MYFGKVIAQRCSWPRSDSGIDSVELELFPYGLLNLYVGGKMYHLIRQKTGQRFSQQRTVSKITDKQFPMQDVLFMTC